MSQYSKSVSRIYAPPFLAKPLTMFCGTLVGKPLERTAALRIDEMRKRHWPKP